MNNLNQNWNNLFGEYTTDETAWHGCWTVYSPNQDVLKVQRAVRSFQSNLDNTVVTHTNRYLDGEDTIVDKKTWHIDRQTCNQPDGVVHPAMPSQRALSFGAGATAWLSPQFIPETPFGLELFFRDGNWRSSVVIVYGTNGQLDKIVHIQEHLGCFSNESPSLAPVDLMGTWIGEKRSMTPSLSISSEEKTRIFFAQLSDGHKLMSLSGGMIVMLPEVVTLDQPMQIIAGQQTIDGRLKQITVHYSALGAFTLFVSASTS
jgi:hypothetical protein